MNNHLLRKTLLLTILSLLLLTINPVSAKEESKIIHHTSEEAEKYLWQNVKEYEVIFMRFLIAEGDATFNLDHPAVTALAGPILTMLIPLWEFLIVLVGIYYVWGGLSPASRAQAKQMITKLIIGLICCSLAYPIFDVFMGLERWCVRQILTNGMGADYATWDPISGRPAWLFDAVSTTISIISLLTFGFGFLLLCPTYCGLISIMLMPYFILAMRNIIVLVLGIFFPVTLFLLSFDFTRGLGNKLMKMSLVWIFVPVAMSVMVVLTYSFTQIPCGGPTQSKDACIPIALATLGSWFLVAGAPMMMTSLMGNAGGVFIHIGRTTQNPRLIFMGHVMRGQGPQSLTETAYYSQLRSARLQSQRSAARGYAEQARLGMKGDGYGARPAPFVMRPPGFGGEPGGGAGGGYGGAGGGYGGAGPPTPAELYGDRPPVYRGSLLSGSRFTGWAAKYDTHGVWDRGISVRERMKRMVFGMAPGAGLSLQHLSAAQFRRKKFEEAVGGWGAAETAGAKAKIAGAAAYHAGRSLFSNLVTTPLMFGAGEMMRGFIRWTIQDWSAGKSIVSIANRMTGMWEEKTYIGKDGNEHKGMVYNYGWQSHRGVIKEMVKAGRAGALEDERRRAAGEMVFGMEGKTALRTGIGLAVACTLFSPVLAAASIPALPVVALGAAGAYMTTKMLKGRGRDDALLEKHGSALEAYEGAEKNGWTGGGGMLERMSAAKTEPERNSIKDELWGELGSKDPSKLNDFLSAAGGDESTAKNNAFDYYMKAATLKDDIWNDKLMSNADKASFMPGAGRPGAGRSVGDKLAGAGAGMVASTGIPPEGGGLETAKRREAERQLKKERGWRRLPKAEKEKRIEGRMGELDAKAKDNAFQHMREVYNRPMAETERLLRGGKTEAPDVISREDAIGALEASHRAAGKDFWTDPDLTAAHRERVIKEKQKGGLDSADAGAVLGGSKIEFGRLDRETRERLINEKSEVMTRREAISELNRDGVEFDSLTDNEKGRLLGDVQHRGHIASRAERWTDEKASKIFGGVAIGAATAAVFATGGVSLLAVGAKGAAVLGVPHLAKRAVHKKFPKTRGLGRRMTLTGLRWFAVTAVPGGALIYPFYRGGKRWGMRKARRAAAGEESRTERYFRKHRWARRAATAGMILSGVGIPWKLGERLGRSAVLRKEEGIQRMADNVASIPGVSGDAAKEAARRMHEEGINTPMHLADMNVGQLSAALSNAGINIEGVEAAGVREAARQIHAGEKTPDEAWGGLKFTTATVEKLKERNLNELMGDDKRVYDELKKADVHRALGVWDITDAAKRGEGVTGVREDGSVVSLGADEVKNLAGKDELDVNRELRDRGIVLRDDVVDGIHDSAKETSREIDPYYTNVTDALTDERKEELGVRFGLTDSGLLQAAGIRSLEQIAEMPHHHLASILGSRYEREWGADRFHDIVSEFRDTASQRLGHGTVSRIEGMSPELEGNFRDRGYDTTSDIAFASRGQLIESGLEAQDLKVMLGNAGRLAESGQEALDSRLFEGTRFEGDAAAQKRMLDALSKEKLVDTPKEFLESSRTGLLGVTGITRDNVDSIQNSAARVYAEGSEERIHGGP